MLTTMESYSYLLCLIIICLLLLDGYFETYFIIRTEEWFVYNVKKLFGFRFKQWCFLRKYGYPVQQINGDIYQRVKIGNEFRMKNNRTGEIL